MLCLDDVVLVINIHIFALRCTSWLACLVHSKALAIIQQGGLNDVALTLEPIARMIPFIVASSSSSSSPLLSPATYSNHLHHLSDDEKLLISESHSPIMIIFHSLASPPPPPPQPLHPSNHSHTSHLPTSPLPAFSDNSHLISLMLSCCRCCCSIISTALESAISSDAAVMTWHHEAAARLCVRLVAHTGVEPDVTSACVAVIGKRFRMQLCD